MSNQLQQDHYKVTPKEHEASKASQDGGDLEGATVFKMAEARSSNYKNRFLKDEKVKEHVEGIDDWQESNVPTQYLEQEVKTIVNKVESPDLSMMYSMNPYAGCEHGCIYCYARNVHEYWGYSAGLDFERKIIVKGECAPR
jgi:hypothetical protein